MRRYALLACLWRRADYSRLKDATAIVPTPNSPEWLTLLREALRHLHARILQDINPIPTASMVCHLRECGDDGRRSRRAVDSAEWLSPSLGRRGGAAPCSLPIAQSAVPLASYNPHDCEIPAHRPRRGRTCSWTGASGAYRSLSFALFSAALACGGWRCIDKYTYYCDFNVISM